MAKKRYRKDQGTYWWLRSESIEITIADLYKMSVDDATKWLVETRYGSTQYMTCPKCRTIDEHYYSEKLNRWKCKACLRYFWPLTDTVFHDAKMPPQEIMATAFLWLTDAGGSPALTVRKQTGKAYLTTFSTLSKIREGLIKGFNVGFLSGEIEMDGSHQSGRRSAEKRGKTLGGKSIDPNNKEEVQAAISEEEEAGEFDPKLGATLPKDRRFVLTARSRHPEPGKGALATRVVVAKLENSDSIAEMVRTKIANKESKLETDADTAYTAIGAVMFDGNHSTVNHSDEFVAADGTTNNNAEEFNFRLDRAEKGVYLNLEPKYLLDYAVENAFRADTRRMKNGEQLRHLFKLICSVGISEYWRGFTHGNHRKVELLVLGEEPAPSSGKPKAVRTGSHSSVPTSVRPPR